MAVWEILFWGEPIEPLIKEPAKSISSILLMILLAPLSTVLRELPMRWEQTSMLIEFLNISGLSNLLNWGSQKFMSIQGLTSSTLAWARESCSGLSIPRELMDGMTRGSPLSEVLFGRELGWRLLPSSCLSKDQVKDQIWWNGKNYGLSTKGLSTRFALDTVQ